MTEKRGRLRAASIRNALQVPSERHFGAQLPTFGVVVPGMDGFGGDRATETRATRLRPQRDAGKLETLARETIRTCLDHSANSRDEEAGRCRTSGRARAGGAT